MVSGITLNRKSLTVLILLSILIPVGYAMALAYWKKPMPETLLDARVRIDAMWVEPNSEGSSKRLIPSVTVLNTTTAPWKNLSIGLNRQFYAGEPKGIPPGETLSIPLEAFIARNGSVKFPVGNRKIEHVTVFAQIDTGARAVAEFKISKELTVPKSDEDANATWIEPAGVKIR
jgi:hypothetical protein